MVGLIGSSGSERLSKSFRTLNFRAEWLQTTLNRFAVTLLIGVFLFILRPALTGTLSTITLFLSLIPIRFCSLLLPVSVARTPMQRVSLSSSVLLVLARANALAKSLPGLMAKPCMTGLPVLVTLSRRRTVSRGPFLVLVLLTGSRLSERLSKALSTTRAPAVLLQTILKSFAVGLLGIIVFIRRLLDSIRLWAITLPLGLILTRLCSLLLPKARARRPRHKPLRLKSDLLLLARAKSLSKALSENLRGLRAHNLPVAARLHIRLPVGWALTFSRALPTLAMGTTTALVGPVAPN